MFIYLQLRVREQEGAQLPYPQGFCPFTSLPLWCLSIYSWESGSRRGTVALPPGLLPIHKSSIMMFIYLQLRVRELEGAQLLYPQGSSPSTSLPSWCFSIYSWESGGRRGHSCPTPRAFAHSQVFHHDVSGESVRNWGPVHVFPDSRGGHTSGSSSCHNSRHGRSWFARVE